MRGNSLHGAGLGLRRENIPDLGAGIPDAIAFFELAPENWLEMGGVRRRDLRHFAERRPIVAHGLSLNLGGSSPLDEVFLQRVRRFLDEYGIALFTEHLSWCAEIRDRFPFPFNLVPPEISWQLATWSELIASVLLVLGLGTRFASASLIVLTVVAWVSVHAGNGYNIVDNGYKLPLIYLVMFVPLFLSGPGKLSLDHWIARRIGGQAAA